MYMGRIILIGVITVAVLIAGGWWYLHWSDIPSASETAELPAALSPTETSTNSKIYRSEDWGVEFEYPSRFVLNTSPSTFWKNFGPYREGYDFFELVDNRRNCYIGPVKAIGLYSEGVTTSSVTVATADAQSLEIRYWTRGDGTTFLGQAGLVTPTEGYQLALNIVSLSSDLIESSLKKSTPSGSDLDMSCIDDFESIITTVKFTK